MQDGMAFADFLTNIPPNQCELVEDISIHQSNAPPVRSYYLRAPELELYCQTCKGGRTFRCATRIPVSNSIIAGANKIQTEVDTPRETAYLHIHYQCSNCQKSEKIYSLGIKISMFEPPNYTAHCCKLGEIPSFGPHIPVTLTGLMSSDELLLFEKGAKSESAGYGIGAYTYYRRIVESQVDTLLSKTVEVLQVNRPPDFEEQIDILWKAIGQKMVGAKLNTAKDSRPQFLFYNGKDLLSVLNERLGL